MFSIEATNQRGWRWISAVFKRRSEVEACFLSIPDAARAMQRIVELPVAGYPVFVVEDRGFEYGSIDFVQARLKGLVPQGDENHVHLNVYAISGDFAPRGPGGDGMGGLPHWHITDWSLEPSRLNLFCAELAAIAGKT